MSKLPTFGLEDIPEDWDIELDADFVKFLGQVNRPWKYDEEGRFIPRQRRGQTSATFWEAGWYSDKRPRMRKLRTPGYFRRNHFYEKLWGYHRYHDAHTSRYGYIKKVDRGNWIFRSELPVLREPFVTPLTDSDVEELVTGIRRAGFTPNPSIIRFDHLPIVADKWWAWLLGFYFSSGCVFERKRYYKNVTWDEVTMVFATHEDVIPFVANVSRNIGNQRFFVRRIYKELNEVKDKGLGTTIRPLIHMGSAVFLVLKKFGLPTQFQRHQLIGGGSRVFNPRIPDWVKENDEFMLAFLEGYVNGTRSCSHLHPAVGQHDVQLPVPNTMVYLNCNGRPERDVKNFLSYIQRWLLKQGVKTTLNKDTGHKTKGSARYILTIADKNGRKWLVDNLDIAKPELRARLFIRQEADKDPILYEVLRKARTPDNVVLGLILEQPSTQSMLQHSLQIRPEGLSESLGRLLELGVITKIGEHYHYKPDKFVSDRIATMQELQAYLKSEIWKYARSLLYQCRNCRKVYLKQHDKCPLCGSYVQPVDRDRVLRPLVLRLRKPRIIEWVLSQRRS